MESVKKQTESASSAGGGGGAIVEVADLDRNVLELYSLLDALLQQCTGPGGGTKAPTRSLYREARAALPPGYQMSIARRPAPVRKVEARLGHNDKKSVPLQAPERCSAWKKGDCQHPLCPQRTKAGAIANCPLPR